MHLNFTPKDTHAFRNCPSPANHWAMAITSFARHRQALVVLGAMTAAIPAAAQQQPSEPAAQAQGTHPPGATRALRLAIEGLTAGLQVRVLSRSKWPREGFSSASCSQDCELKLQEGAYTLMASRGDDQRTKDIELTSSQVLKVGEWDGRVRTFGTMMGITGIVVGTLSTVVSVAMARSSRTSWGPDASSDSTPTLLLLAPLGILVGMGLTIGGFSLAAANQAPSMDLVRMPMTYPPPGSPAAGLSLSGRL